MELSTYLKTLYPAIGMGQKKSDFIITLIRHSTISEPVIKSEMPKIKQLDEYLLNLSDDLCCRIYNGKKPLNKKIAGLIISIFDSNKLEDYLSEFSNELIDYIGKKFEEKGNPIDDNDVISYLASQFKEILFIIASTPRKKPSRKLPIDIMDLDPFDKSNIFPPETIIKMQQDRIRMPSLYK